jgi:hypothetical protein
MARRLEQYPLSEGGRIALTMMQNTSWRQLTAIFNRQPVHVLHLAVAVETEQDQGMLVLEDAGRPEVIAAKELAQFVEQSELSLVVLSAVREDQWTAVLQAADALVADGVPAVAALPAVLPPEVMAQGVATLLDQLADGAWLDTAAAAARQAMAALRKGEAAGIDLALFTSTPHGNMWRSAITAVDLYEALAGGFTLADMQALCAVVQVDFNSLVGDGRRGKMVSLVREMQGANRLQTLAVAMLDARPNTNFAYRQQAPVGETAVPSALLDRQTLLRLMNDQFNLEEIRILCLDLDVDYEALGGQTKSNKVRELIDYQEKQGTLPQLVDTVLRQRPHLRDQFQAAQAEPTADPVEIFRILVDQFSLQDLLTLILSLGINAEDLPGSTLPARARELVLWMQRHGRLPELMQAMQRSAGLPVTPGETSQIDIDFGEGVVTIGGVELPIQEDYGTSPATPPTEGINKKGAEEVISRALTEYFTSDDLNTVSFEMGIDYEELGGESRAAKARALVQMARQQNRLPELAEVIRRARPQVDWGDFEEAE